MSLDVVQDLVDLYRASIPDDVTATAVATDVAYTIATVIAAAEEEASRLFAGAKISSATGLFVDQHLRDHGLRRQNGETDAQAKARLQRPPSAVTPKAILDAVNLIVSPKASLALATTNCSTIVEAVAGGADGNLISLKFVADGTGSGSLTSVGTALTFHYSSGVTTVADFEAAVALNPLIEVQTIDGVGVLTAPGDTFGKTFLTGGLDRASLIETANDAMFFDRDGYMDVEAYLGGGRGVVIVLIPQSANALQSTIDAVRAKVSAGKIWFVLEYTP